jgi:hypothetical protein
MASRNRGKCLAPQSQTSATKSAQSGLMHCSKWHLYLITSSARASSVAAGQSHALTCRVEEPSTASGADLREGGKLGLLHHLSPMRLGSHCWCACWLSVSEFDPGWTFVLAKLPLSARIRNAYIHFGIIDEFNDRIDCQAA